jgi:hypothetical protein
MKKKYLLNGKIYTEEDLTPFAKENQLDLNVYVQEVGATEFNDANTYEFQGKEYTGNDLADFARENEMPFQDYLKEIGAKKKADTLPSKQDLGSGGAASASAVQSTESEGGLFAPLQVPKMFAEKTLKVKETEAPKGKYTLEKEGETANVTRDDIFKNIDNEEFLKGIQSGEVKINIQDDDALGNLLNEKLSFYNPKVEPKALKEETSAWQDFGRGIYNSAIDAVSGFGQIAAQYLSPLPIETSQDIKSAQKEIIRQKADEFKMPTSDEYNNVQLTEVFNGNPYAAAKIGAETVPSLVGAVAGIMGAAPVVVPGMAVYYYGRSYDGAQRELKDIKIPQSYEFHTVKIRKYTCIKFHHIFGYCIRRERIADLVFHFW